MMYSTSLWKLIFFKIFFDNSAYDHLNLNILGILILLSIKPLLGFGMSSKKVFRGLVVSCEDQYSLQHLNSMLSC